MRSKGFIFNSEEAARDRHAMVRTNKMCRGCYIVAWDPEKPFERVKYIYPKQIYIKRGA